MTMTPDQERRRIALDQGVQWALSAGAQGGKNEISDVVKAADEFHTFLVGAPVSRGPRPLAELYDNVQWDDPQWRQEFLIGVTDSIVGGLRIPRWLEAVGNVAESSGPAIVKGVRDLEATSIERSDDPTSSSAPVAIERTWRVDQPVYEIAPRLTPEFKTKVHEDEILSKTPPELEEFMLALIGDARKTLDDWILGAVIGLLDSVGYDLDPEVVARHLLDIELLAPVVPFRFEFVRFDGWRAKEWMEEGGEYWHLWIKGKFGAAVFKPVGPDGMLSGLADPPSKSEQLAQPSIDDARD